MSEPGGVDGSHHQPSPDPYELGACWDPVSTVHLGVDVTKKLSEISFEETGSELGGAPVTPPPAVPQFPDQHQYRGWEQDAAPSSMVSRQTSDCAPAFSPGVYNVPQHTPFGNMNCDPPARMAAGVGGGAPSNMAYHHHHHHPSSSGSPPQSQVPPQGGWGFWGVPPSTPPGFGGPLPPYMPPSPSSFFGGGGSSAASTASFGRAAAFGAAAAFAASQGAPAGTFPVRVSSSEFSLFGGAPYWGPELGRHSSGHSFGFSSTFSLDRPASNMSVDTGSPFAVDPAMLYFKGLLVRHGYCSGSPGATSGGGGNHPSGGGTFNPFAPFPAPPSSSSASSSAGPPAPPLPSQQYGQQHPSVYYDMAPPTNVQPSWHAHPQRPPQEQAPFHHSPDGPQDQLQQQRMEMDHSGVTEPGAAGRGSSSSASSSFPPPDRPALSPAMRPQQQSRHGEHSIMEEVRASRHHSQQRHSFDQVNDGSALSDVPDLWGVTAPMPPSLPGLPGVSGMSTFSSHQSPRSPGMRAAGGGGGGGGGGGINGGAGSGNLYSPRVPFVGREASTESRASEDLEEMFSDLEQVDTGEIDEHHHPLLEEVGHMYSPVQCHHAPGAMPPPVPSMISGAHHQTQHQHQLQHQHQPSHPHQQHQLQYPAQGAPQNEVRRVNSFEASDGFEGFPILFQDPMYAHLLPLHDVSFFQHSRVDAGFRFGCDDGSGGDLAFSVAKKVEHVADFSLVVYFRGCKVTSMPIRLSLQGLTGTVPGCARGATLTPEANTQDPDAPSLFDMWEDEGDASNNTLCFRKTEQRAYKFKASLWLPALDAVFIVEFKSYRNF